MDEIRIIKRICFFAKKYRWSFLLSYTVLLVELACGQVLPLLLAEVINVAVYDVDISKFLIVTFYYALVFFAHTLCGFIQLQLWQRVNNEYVYDIRIACYRKVLRLKPHILANIKTGDVIRTINSDVSEFHHIIQRFGMRVVNAGIGVVVSMSIVAFLKWEIALLMLVIIPISSIVTTRIERKMKKASDEVRDKQGHCSAWTIEILKGMREIKMFAVERNVLRLFMKRNHDIVRASTKQDYIQFQAGEIISGIYFMTDILFYITCAVFVANADIDIGQYMAIATYFSMITYNIKRVLQGKVDYQRRKTCVERVLSLLDEDEENNVGLLDFEVTEGKIEIQNLSFAYDQEKIVLKNINIQISPGETIGIVGRSGVGKSTFANLLLKFYEPQIGDIFIDGKNLKDYKSSSIRQAIGIVRQENILFNTTIRENITLGFHAFDEELWEILDKVCLKDETEQLPDGLDTVLGNGGVVLSGGQYQRLCIARLFFRNPPIIILDEATSALDIQSEIIVQEALEKLTEGKTTIVISHRYQALMKTDRILVLHEGEQVGCDSYDKLLTENRYFADMFEKQKAVSV